MAEANIVAYCELMTEIRHRAAGIAKLQRPNRKYVADFVRVECLVLQLRKIMELIALGSMVFNETAYRAAYSSFEKHSHAERILRDIERINPDFYPRPAIRTESDQPSVDHHIVIVDNPDESYLRRKDFGKIYEKCGGLLHAQNPFGAKRDYHYYESHIPVWIKKIEKLMQFHLIRLVDDQNFYLVAMKSVDDQPHAFTCSPSILDT